MSNKIYEHYKSLFLNHGDGIESAQYSTKESQYQRFKYLSEISDLKNSTILDYGCGTSSLYDFLISVDKQPNKYIGIDIVEEFLEFSKKKIPSGLFCKPHKISSLDYDYGFVSGVFNNIRENNKDFWQQTIRTIFKYCSKGIAFNMMSTYVDYQDNDLYYESPEEVFKFVKSEITPFVTLRHNYIVKDDSIPFEFIIYAYKEPSRRK